MEPSKKRRRVSKHKKSAQRLLDISSEVEGLQKVDDEIRQHGGLLEEKKDAELFSMDTSKMDDKEIESQIKLSQKQKARGKTAMVDRILNPYSNVKAVRQPRSKSNKAEEYQKRFTARKEANKISAKLNKKSSHPEVYDIWGEGAKTILDSKIEKGIDGRGVGHGTKKYTKPNLLTSMSKGTDLDRKDRKCDKLELPVPGQSYKPTKIDHQNLLRKEHTKIVKEQEATAKIERKVAWDVSQAATEEDLRKELTSGLFEEDSEWEDAEPDPVPDEPIVVKVNQPKSAKAKKNVKLEEQKLKEIRKEKELKHQMAQIYNSKRILKEAEEEEQKIMKKAAERLEKKNAVFPRLSTTKYQEPHKELKLSDEIKPTLRELVIEGHILKDRYDSLVKRAIIEPHTAHRKKYLRRFKTKLKVKRSVKRALGETIG